MNYATFYEYKQAISKMFAKNGFIHTPLNYRELVNLWDHGIDLNDVYTIGCDVNAGFSFRVAFIATVSRGE